MARARDPAAQEGELEMAGQPNIVFFHVDNLGFGELSCYSGGPFRGTWTRRIDAFAGQGFRLTNYAPEAQCTPTRSALLTGRHAIRSGNHSVPLGAPGGWGLVAWEKTLGDLLTEGATAARPTVSGTSGRGRAGGRPTMASPSGTGRPAPTMRRCGSMIPGMTRPGIRCRGW
jgi:Sulfatase